MKKNTRRRLLLPVISLVMVVSLLYTGPSMQVCRADAGGACLGQWSECYAKCDNEYWWFTISNAVCKGGCDAQRNRCVEENQ